MRALAEASVHTVECALDWHVHILLMDLAIGASILWVAHTGSIVAPSGISTVVGACSDAAVLSSKAWLAPASAIQAKAIVRAV
jgi:hypothetical protein